MAPTQRIKVANEKASKNITLRGNVPKSTVRFSWKFEDFHSLKGKESSFSSYWILVRVGLVLLDLKERFKFKRTSNLNLKNLNILSDKVVNCFESSLNIFRLKSVIRYRTTLQWHIAHLIWHLIVQVENILRTIIIDIGARDLVATELM